MRIYSGGRSVGKTYAMIQHLKEKEESLLVVRDTKEVLRLENQYPGQHNARILAIETFMRRSHQGLRHNEIQIDGIEVLLHHISPKITGFSTNEAEFIVPWKVGDIPEHMGIEYSMGINKEAWPEKPSPLTNTYPGNWRDYDEETKD